MQCCVSMTFWCRSGSGDPCWWLMDPDLDPNPAIFVINLQDAKKNILYVFLLITFWRYIYIIFQKVKKKSQNNRNQGFPYYFCSMTEGSGSESVSLTSWSGSRRPKNIRIRIRNTELMIIVILYLAPWEISLSRWVPPWWLARGTRAHTSGNKPSTSGPAQQQQQLAQPQQHRKWGKIEGVDEEDYVCFQLYELDKITWTFFTLKKQILEFIFWHGISVHQCRRKRRFLIFRSPQGSI